MYIIVSIQEDEEECESDEDNSSSDGSEDSKLMLVPGQVRQGFVVFYCSFGTGTIVAFKSKLAEGKMKKDFYAFACGYSKKFALQRKPSKNPSIFERTAQNQFLCTLANVRRSFALYVLYVIVKSFHAF